MAYRNRLIDAELRRKLDSSGAVLIRGPKSCGKTESALRVAQSVLRVDIDENVTELMNSAPKRLLLGKTPRLIDEWQAQPKAVRSF
jgi:predicted AAA+ superfamily ATPase